MKVNQVNWFGLTGGIMIVGVVILSAAFAYPWWELTVGQEFLKADVSPLNTHFSVFGTVMTIPLIWVLNITCLLSLIASAIAILIYSVVPTRSYSKHLLGFAYKKPLFTLLLFVIGIFAIAFVFGALLQISFPVAGSTTLTVPASMSGSTTIKMPIVTGFTWVFWLAVAATVLCIAARVYHRRIALTAPPTEPQAKPPMGA